MSTRYRRNPLVEVAPMEDETILYHPGPNRFCVLNRAAATVWQGLSDPASPPELAAALRARFTDVDEVPAAHDVDRLLGRLAELELVEQDGSAEPQRQSPAAEPASDLPYQPPTVTIMSEQEILEAFQVTSAGVTWWVM